MTEVLKMTTEREIPTSFSDLPPEIRNQIWEDVVDTSRIVVLELKGDKLYSGTAHPTILSICKESRAYGLDVYTLDLGLYGVNLVPTSIWVNPNRDFIYIYEDFGNSPVAPDEATCSMRLRPLARLYNYIGPTATEKIQHLIIKYSSIFHHALSPQCSDKDVSTDPNLRIFMGIKTFSIIHQNPEQVGEVEVLEIVEDISEAAQETK